MSTIDRFTTQASALGLAALMTLASLGSVAKLAAYEAGRAQTEMLVAEAPLSPVTQRVEIVGHRVQHIVVTGHRARA
jgi:hypothetical protein